jgi:hypothetical protein
MDDLADCRARQTNGPRRRSALACQHEHRNVPRGLGLVFAEGRRLRDQLGPQLGAGAAVEFLCHYRERMGTDLGCETRVDFEVVVQSGWVGDPPLAATLAKRPSGWG